MELADQFRRMGLNKYQSEILAALLEDPELTAEQLSEKSGVPYTKIYQVLCSLEATDFIRSTLERPKKYRATEPESIVRLLAKRYEDCLLEVKNQGDILLAAMHE
jgi:sugar-specific transcriptional regulator TrmB